MSLSCNWCGMDIMSKGYPYEYFYYTRYVKDGYGKANKLIEKDPRVDELKEKLGDNYWVLLGRSSVAGDGQSWGWISESVEGILEAIDTSLHENGVLCPHDFVPNEKSSDDHTRQVFCVESCAIQRFYELAPYRLIDEYNDGYHLDESK